MISCSHFDYKRFVKFQIRENLDYQKQCKIHLSWWRSYVGRADFPAITKLRGNFSCNSYFGLSASFIGVVEILHNARSHDNETHAWVNICHEKAMNKS